MVRDTHFDPLRLPAGLRFLRCSIARCELGLRVDILDPLDTFPTWLESLLDDRSGFRRHAGAVCQTRRGTLLFALGGD